MNVFKPEDFHVTFNPMGHGLTLATAWAGNWPSPLSLVWGLHTGGDRVSFDVYQSYTVEFARRNGLRTFINDALFKDLGIEIITSGNATQSGGLQFVKSYGYKLSKSGHWYVTKKMHHLHLKKGEQ